MPGIGRLFEKYIAMIDEHYYRTNELVGNPALRKFGVADTTLDVIARHGALLITDDLPLAGYIQKQGFEVLNFNHLRYANPRR